jgi:hypothetical protein
MAAGLSRDKIIFDYNTKSGGGQQPPNVVTLTWSRFFDFDNGGRPEALIRASGL